MNIFAEVMPQRKLEYLGFEDKNGAIRDLKSITESDLIIDNEPQHGFGRSRVSRIEWYVSDCAQDALCDLLIYSICLSSSY